MKVYYSTNTYWYYGNGQPGDFQYTVNVLCVGNLQMRWYS